MDSNWNDGFIRLRKKWGTVPVDVISGRVESSTLLELSDQQLAEKWMQVRDRDVQGPGFEVRGWFHELYRDFVRGRKMLDIGCGFGISSISFLEMGAKVTFVDIVEDNVKLVEKVCRGLGIADRASFFHMQEIASLDQLASDYDVILALGSLHHAPQSFIKPEYDALLRRLKAGGRWLQLAYPNSRWQNDGSPPFQEWGVKTDGEGTPWAEPYDMAKLLELMQPATMQPILYHEWHNADFNWFDMKLVSIT